MLIKQNLDAFILNCHFPGEFEALDDQTSELRISIPNSKQRQMLIKHCEEINDQADKQMGQISAYWHSILRKTRWARVVNLGSRVKYPEYATWYRRLDMFPINRSGTSTRPVCQIGFHPKFESNRDGRWQFIPWLWIAGGRNSLQRAQEVFADGRYKCSMVNNLLQFESVTIGRRATVEGVGSALASPFSNEKLMRNVLKLVSAKAVSLKR